jgi:hypothetical protein
MASMLRPMSIAELLDKTFSLYREHVIVLTVIVAIPNLFLLLFRLIQVSMLSFLSSKPVGLILMSLAVFVVYLAVALISLAATIVAVSDIYLGEKTGIGKSYAGIKSCLLALLFIFLLVGMGIALLPILLIITAFVLGWFWFVPIFLILFTVPVILLSLAWSLSAPIAVIEKLGPIDSMARSARLTKGSRGRIFVILLVAIVIIGIVNVIFQFPILIITLAMLGKGQPVPSWALVSGHVLAFISSSLVGPIFTIATSLSYYDLRVRKEGFDLQFMMSSLQSPSQTPPETLATPSQI